MRWNLDYIAALLARQFQRSAAIRVLATALLGWILYCPPGLKGIAALPVAPGSFYSQLFLAGSDIQTNIWNFWVNPACLSVC